MSRWLLNLLSVALVASILAAVPLAYRAYEPVHQNNRAVEAMREHKYDEAIALLSEIADLDRDDDGDVIIGTVADGHNDLMSRIAAFLAANDQ